MPTPLNVYSSHGSSNIKLPPYVSVEGVRDLAAHSARLGHTAFYRVFERTPESVTGERFLTAFSVIDGKVREHPSVTIPSAHW